METKNVKLSPPWVTFVEEVKALFGQDPEVKIHYDENQNELKLYVENARKADALAQLLPAEKEFGAVKLKIAVVPSNAVGGPANLFADAFYGNPVLDDILDYKTVFGQMTYLMFQNKVVQFWNDQMDDPNGIKSTLFQEIAKDVFNEQGGVFFCTTAPVNLTKPLGEWP